MPVIATRGLTKSFGPRTLWEGLDLSIDAGEVVALTGTSGSGKSTLLNALALLVPVDAGEIVVDGQHIERLGGRGRRLYRRDTLGFLFQNYALIEDATVAENLRLAVSAWGFRSRGGLGVSEALERVGLTGRERERVHVLSGGEQQRVAVARLLMKRPPVILADEPTGALDADNADMVVQSLHDLAAGGAAILVATHNDEVRRACHREIHLTSTATRTTTAA